MRLLHGSIAKKFVVHLQQKSLYLTHENNPPDGFLLNTKASYLLPRGLDFYGGDIFLLPDVVAIFLPSQNQAVIKANIFAFAIHAVRKMLRMQHMHIGVAELRVVIPAQTPISIPDATQTDEKENRMAYFSDTQTARNAQPSRIAALFSAIGLKLRQRAMYRKTYNELCSMTDRDLADLGMSRSEFRRIAREAAELVR